MANTALEQMDSTLWLNSKITSTDQLCRYAAQPSVEKVNVKLSFSCRKPPMVYQLELDNYKHEVADFYDRRSQTYDDNESLVQICHHLLEYSQVDVGQTVLDIGTGTGHLAIASAQVIGDKGRVIGIDISARMLGQARIKIDALGLHNIELQLADAEAIDYPINSFDHILCTNTFPWLEDKEATLRLWQQFLKPGGRISIHTPADTAYIGGVVVILPRV